MLHLIPKITKKLKYSFRSRYNGPHHILLEKRSAFIWNCMEPSTASRPAGVRSALVIFCRIVRQQISEEGDVESGCTLLTRWSRCCYPVCGPRRTSGLLGSRGSGHCRCHYTSRFTWHESKYLHNCPGQQRKPIETAGSSTVDGEGRTASRPGRDAEEGLYDWDMGSTVSLVWGSCRAP